MCTILLVSGAERFVLPTTLIGLHTGFTVGTGDKAENWDEVEAWYRRKGMGDLLLAKMRAHQGPTDFYEPTLRELVINGFATDIYDEHVSGYIPALQWCNENAIACSRTGHENMLAERASKK